MGEKKKVKWLHQDEAVYLGLNPKPNAKNRTQNRYYLTQKEWLKILEYRFKNDERRFVDKIQKLDRHGEVTSITQKLEAPQTPVPDNFKIIKISQSPTTGQEWVQYAPITEEENDTFFEDLKQVLEKEINKVYQYEYKHQYKKDSEAVLKWADLHFGAHIRNLILTKDYDSNILEKELLKSVYETNEFGFKKVHVHINGDLIESFSGLNHINSWRSMDKNEVGANAVRLCSKLLHKVLSKIDNLGQIKIVAGNHDRTSKRNDEDVKGDAANLISYCLELMGYDVEFHPYITCQTVDGIHHINLHGDKGISKRPTKDIIWDYGIKGKFNFVFEAHLHSIIEKLSVSQRNAFKTIKDDGIDHRRIHLPSFFTGNYYSETLNFNSNSGYVLIWWDDVSKKPKMFYG